MGASRQQLKRFITLFFYAILADVLAVLNKLVIIVEYCILRALPEELYKGRISRALYFKRYGSYPDQQIMLRVVQRSFAGARNLCTAASQTLSEDLRNRIDKMVKSDDVVVFMKGTQQEPMCGFSRNVKLVLDFHNVKFRDYNVLEDAELREGIKIYSEWPTIPQVFMKGEFVGGCDIMVQMHKDGEISDFFDSKGIPSRYGEKK
ncbi:Monothiol glutaredoxin-5 mitochondrial [Trichostrongylus colubriformis]|uniref:Glutaredoxin-related protein 5, mitochondrial n=1 Tax=Trichostrongylus colubriformis TaxID=6319 RepID=A0AAN8IDS0_TRICO